MILLSENRALVVNGKLMQRKVNSLSFRVRGTKFPISERVVSTARFQFIFDKPQSIKVNWGDGVVSTYNSNFSAGNHRIFWVPDYLTDIYAVPEHIYTDSNSGDRVITFSFDTLEAVKSIVITATSIQGAFSEDIKFCSELTELSVRFTKGITSFPRELSNKKLSTLRIEEAYATKSTKIPDSFFELDLGYLDLSNSYNCSDFIGSNLFKLNSQKNLSNLRLGNCNITTLGENFQELTKLLELFLAGNPFTYFPTEIEKLVNIVQLRIDIIGDDLNFIDFKDLNKLASLHLFGNFNMSEIPLKWKGLKSLGSLFFSFTYTPTRTNAFIDNFYELCTTNGSIVANGSPAPYTNRFRNISWGNNFYAFTGAKVAPSGYVQGASNGTPINQGQKVYVLQNQYNHTVTHA